MSHPLALYLKRFFSHYLPLQKGLSPQSLAAYRDSVKLLLCYCADQLKVSVDALEVESLSSERVSDFLDHLEDKRGSCIATRNARLAAIRTLFAFIAREAPELIAQCQAIRALPIKRTTPSPVTYLEEPEMQAVLGSVDLSERTGVRDQALLLLLYNTGARVSEIVALTDEDLHLHGASAQVQLHGKGGKTRSCPLWPETVEAVEAYLLQRQPRDPRTRQLFLNTNGAPITRFGIRYITRQYGTRALPKGTTKALNPHVIRHTTAMHLLHAGNDITLISYWLGHADINTTHQYVEIDMAMKRRMLERAPAPSVAYPLPWQQPQILQWLASLTRRPELCAASP
jgi:site-specific recombinase XerD